MVAADALKEVAALRIMNKLRVLTGTLRAIRFGAHQRNGFHSSTPKA